MRSPANVASAIAVILLALCSSDFGEEQKSVATKIPDKLIVLTFDDSVASHATFVGPLLKRLGFGATFFITEGFEFAQDKEHYMTWEQIKKLHDDGFEIGNHTRHHTGVAGQALTELSADVEYIETQCAAHGIPRPTSFCYPGYQTSEPAVKLLSERGYKFARAGGSSAFDPAKDNALTMPQAFDSKPGCTLEQFKSAVATAKDGKIAVMTFHGVPDIKHPWVNTAPEQFEKYMQYLKDEKCTVISVRDMEKYAAKKPR
jgi:peptidoglycan-N-acetylglucosamine deacetylase